MLGARRLRVRYGPAAATAAAAGGDGAAATSRAAGWSAVAFGRASADAPCGAAATAGGDAFAVTVVELGDLACPVRVPDRVDERGGRAAGAEGAGAAPRRRTRA